MSQSLTQFAQEVGRSRDTVNRAIVALGLTIPKPQPGKPTPLSPAVQDALRTYFGAYPAIPAPQSAEPRLMSALERIYKVNLEAHRRTQAQVSELQKQVGFLKAELETLTDRLAELQAVIVEPRQITPPPEVPKRSTLVPIALVATLLMAVALWFSQQSPSLQTDRLSDPSRAELYQ
jgi:uncharacterized coiled-coil protein SlyX